MDLYTLQKMMTHKVPDDDAAIRAPYRDDALKRGANVMSRIVARQRRPEGSFDIANCDVKAGKGRKVVMVPFLLLAEWYNSDIKAREADMPKMATSEARDHFTELINRAAHQGERTVIRRRGKGMAAIIPMEDFDLFEKVEDLIDRDLLEKAEARRFGRRDDPVGEGEGGRGPVDGGVPLPDQNFPTGRQRRIARSRRTCAGGSSRRLTRSRRIPALAGRGRSKARKPRTGSAWGIIGSCTRCTTACFCVLVMNVGHRREVTGGPDAASGDSRPLSGGRRQAGFLPPLPRITRRDHQQEVAMKNPPKKKTPNNPRLKNARSASKKTSPPPLPLILRIVLHPIPPTFYDS